jgi:integrase
MRYQDVDEDGRTKVGRTKNGTPFVAVMTRELSAEFKRFAESADPEHLIFSGPNFTDRPFCLDKKFKETVECAGLPRSINIHTLRHTCASILASKGASTIEILEFLNHRTPSMAARYTHLNVQHRQRRAEELLGGLMDQREAAQEISSFSWTPCEQGDAGRQQKGLAAPGRSAPMWRARIRALPPAQSA